MPVKRADKQETRLLGKLLGGSGDRLLKQQVDLVQKELFMLRELLTGHDERLLDVERRESGDSKDSHRRLKQLESVVADLKKTLDRIGPDGAAHRAERILKLEDTIEGLSRLIPDSDAANRQYVKAKKEIMALRHDLDKLAAALTKLDAKRAQKEEKDVSHLDHSIAAINERLERQGKALERLEREMRELSEFTQGTEEFLDRRFGEESQKLHSLFDERERRLEAMASPIAEHEQRAEKRLRHELDSVHDVLAAKEDLLEQQVKSAEESFKKRLADLTADFEDRLASTEQGFEQRLDKVRKEEASKAAKRFASLDKRIAGVESGTRDFSHKVQDRIRETESMVQGMEVEVSTHRDIEEELLAAREQDDIRTLARYIETELLPRKELPEIETMLREEGFADHILIPALQSVHEHR